MHADVHQKVCAEMFTAAWFATAPNCELSSVHQSRMHKLQHIYTVEYYTAETMNKQTPTTYDNMHEAHKHPTEQKKADTKRTHFMKSLMWSIKRGKTHLCCEKTD